MKFALVIIETEASRAAIRRDRTLHRAKLEAWMALMGTQGVLVGGDAFETERTAPVTIRRLPSGALEVSEGPFAGTSETLGGYVLVEAADRDAAVEIAKTWPDTGETIEVRPLWIP